MSSAPVAAVSLNSAAPVGKNSLQVTVATSQQSKGSCMGMTNGHQYDIQRAHAEHEILIFVASCSHFASGFSQHTNDGWMRHTPTIKFKIAMNDCPLRWSTDFQGSGIALPSRCDCESSKRSFVNIFQSTMLWQTGPADALMDVCPSTVVLAPFRGNLLALGLIPYRPLNAAGARIDPPMSVRGLIGLPSRAIKATSPPEDPCRLHQKKKKKSTCLTK
jgi:hypothetical protein